jgi:hypothetical protein
MQDGVARHDAEDAADIAAAEAFRRQLAAGKRDGTAQTMKKLALALDVTVDDLI